MSETDSSKPNRRRPTDTPPRIVANTRRNPRTVQVQYVFADGRRVAVAVPYLRWMDGGHAPVGPAVARTLLGLDLQSERLSSSIPE